MAGEAGFSVENSEGIVVASDLSAGLAEVITEVLNGTPGRLEISEEFIDFCEEALRRTRGNTRRAVEIVLAQREAELRRRKHLRELLRPEDHGRLALASRGIL